MDTVQRLREGSGYRDLIAALDWAEAAATPTPVATAYRGFVSIGRFTAGQSKAVGGPPEFGLIQQIWHVVEQVAATATVAVTAGHGPNHGFSHGLRSRSR